MNKHARPMVACKARTIITILLALVAILSDLTSAMRHPARAPVSQFWYFRMC